MEGEGGECTGGLGGREERVEQELLGVRVERPHPVRGAERERGRRLAASRLARRGEQLQAHEQAAGGRVERALVALELERDRGL